MQRNFYIMGAWRDDLDVSHCCDSEAFRKTYPALQHSDPRYILPSRNF